MVEDLLTSVVQIAGNLTGMAIKYGAIMALPGAVSVMLGAPITLAAALLPAMIYGLPAMIGILITLGILVPKP
jgi:hypothetical protein